MGDHREMLLDLSVDESSAEARMCEVRNWFRANGWSAPAPDNYDPRHIEHISDGPGPRLREQLDSRSPHFVFTFIPGRDFYYAGSVGGPQCRECGEYRDFDEAAGMIQEWLDSHREPELTCPSCSWKAPWGNWDLSWSLVLSALAVIIHQDSQTPDPQELSRHLTEQLQADLGGRWVLMHFKG
ncbi:MULTISPECIES: hypothetical protein [unclassified Arthrobacter]|uniref:hypothetical protein n=1 Tax=unclassified Arthrobacter TaxID=235627 RepID=UPI002105F2F2|nr:MULTISPECIES: hypothetical protein [unclassified Arthrobacter]MCQ1947190.1 hypothetical protein [Arthrobacter sp. zg-Y1116]MCQ1995323.1 hypothetical protein [Arthrobacter sp. zg-Y1171]UWX80638.1 hypothetical protein N2L00_09315 [Arthrobacter sp. zg-Y1171]